MMEAGKTHSAPRILESHPARNLTFVYLQKLSTAQGYTATLHLSTFCMGTQRCTFQSPNACVWCACARARPRFLSRDIAISELTTTPGCFFTLSRWFKSVLRKHLLFEGCRRENRSPPIDSKVRVTFSVIGRSWEALSWTSLCPSARLLYL